ncbi:MAG: hypothetical protein RLZ47_601 [Bacteroidota bacterium]|jgi:hypothetical protein
MKKLIFVMALATSVSVVFAQTQQPKESTKKEACCKKEGEKAGCEKDSKKACCQKKMADAKKKKA